MNSPEKGKWKEIPGWEGYYQANTLGEIRRDPSHPGRGRSVPGALLNGYVNKGYRKVTLHRPGKRKLELVHVLIARTFLQPSQPQVNHKNLNKLDNRIENLEWCTKAHNQAHATLHGVTKGVNNGRARLSEENVLTMRGLREYYGLSIKEIANRFKISQTACQYALTGKNWSHVH